VTLYDLNVVTPSDSDWFSERKEIENLVGDIWKGLTLLAWEYRAEDPAVIEAIKVLLRRTLDKNHIYPDWL